MLMWFNLTSALYRLRCSGNRKTHPFLFSICFILYFPHTLTNLSNCLFFNLQSRSVILSFPLCPLWQNGWCCIIYLYRKDLELILMAKSCRQWMSQLTCTHLRLNRQRTKTRQMNQTEALFVYSKHLNDCTSVTYFSIKWSHTNCKHTDVVRNTPTDSCADRATVMRCFPLPLP